MNSRINKNLIPQIIHKAMNAFSNDFYSLAPMVRIDTDESTGTKNKDGLDSEKITSLTLRDHESETLSELDAKIIDMSVCVLIDEITKCFSDVRFGDLWRYEIKNRLPSTDAYYRSQGDHYPIVDPKTQINLLLSFYDHPHNDQVVIIEFTALWGIRKIG